MDPMHPGADAAALTRAQHAQMIFAAIGQIAGDVAKDSTNPVIVEYGVGVEVLAATIQGLIGLFSKMK